jgi:hypothetical protein
MTGEILAAGKMMKALNPEQVVPGHGTPGTVNIFEDGEQYYTLLMDRVGQLMKDGKPLDDIKKDVKMPEYASWAARTGSRPMSAPPPGHWVPSNCRRCSGPY